MHLSGRPFIRFYSKINLWIIRGSFTVIRVPIVLMYGGTPHLLHWRKPIGFGFPFSRRALLLHSFFLFSFVRSEKCDIFAMSILCWKSRRAWGGDWQTYNKGVTNALVLTHLNFANSTACQKQSNGDASLGVLYTTSCCFRRFVPENRKERFIYLHVRGAFSIARFDKQGNAKA